MNEDARQSLQSLLQTIGEETHVPHHHSITNTNFQFSILLSSFYSVLLSILQGTYSVVFSFLSRTSVISPTAVVSSFRQCG